ncbi:MAG: hypothetical protein P8077_04490, partial [Gammaproteobacteria bacterium]
MIEVIVRSLLAFCFCALVRLGVLLILCWTYSGVMAAEPVDLGSEEPLEEQAASDALWLKVAAPYIDVYTGPGQGYPVSQVVEKGDLF